MKTITGKNQKAAIFAAAKNICLMSIANNFGAVAVESLTTKDISIGKLQQSGEKFCLTIHSNKWFVFEN